MDALSEIEIVKHLDNMVTEILSNHSKYLYEYYVDERTFMDHLGIRPTKFYELKKLGRFEKAMHPTSRGSKRVLYHKFFNFYSQRIEFPELRRLPVEKPKQKRNRQKKEEAVICTPA